MNKKFALGFTFGVLGFILIAATTYKKFGSVQIKSLYYKTPTTLTIASGSITPTQSNHLITTQSGASTDDLDTVDSSNAVDGMVIYLTQSSTDSDIVIKDGTNNIVTGIGDYDLDAGQTIGLLYNSSTGNFSMSGGGGGGSSTYTANRALQSSGAGAIEASSVTATQLGYVDATSSIQTQINTKLASPIGAGYVTDSMLSTAINANKIGDGTVTNAEYQYNDATSSIQTQLDAKLAAPISSGYVTDSMLSTGINTNKLADGTVSSTEFQYINSLSSNAQNQIDTKLTAPISSGYVTDSMVCKRN